MLARSQEGPSESGPPPHVTCYLLLVLASEGPHSGLSSKNHFLHEATLSTAAPTSTLCHHVDYLETECVCVFGPPPTPHSPTQACSVSTHAQQGPGGWTHPTQGWRAGEGCWALGCAHLAPGTPGSPPPTQGPQALSYWMVTPSSSSPSPIFQTCLPPPEAGLCYFYVGKWLDHYRTASRVPNYP